MDPILHIVLIVVGSIIVYATMGGFITGIWMEIWPVDKWDRTEFLVMCGGFWPATLVSMITIAAHHIGRAAVRHCESFIRL